MKAPKHATTATAVLREVHEPGRLDILDGYAVLDTDPEQAFDELVQLSGFICGTPISLISLVDSERQ